MFPLKKYLHRSVNFHCICSSVVHLKAVNILGIGQEQLYVFLPYREIRYRAQYELNLHIAGNSNKLHSKIEQPSLLLIFAAEQMKHAGTRSKPLKKTGTVVVVFLFLKNY